MANAPSFAIYYAGDAYSTANKIMGRQSAGKAFMRGVARTWPQSTLHGMGQGTPAAKAMLGQLRGDGFAGELKWIEVPHWAAGGFLRCVGAGPRGVCIAGRPGSAGSAGSQCQSLRSGELRPEDRLLAEAVAVGGKAGGVIG